MKKKIAIAIFLFSISAFVFAQIFPLKLKSFEAKVYPLNDEKYYFALKEKIRSAKESIYICMFLFKVRKDKPSPVNEIEKELIKAAKRGVKVYVLLEYSEYKEDLNNSNYKTAIDLKKNGINVYFDNPFKTTHSKVVVIDQKYTFLGSHNFTHSSLKYNEEFSILIESENFAKYCTDYIKLLMKTAMRL